MSTDATRVSRRILLGLDLTVLVMSAGLIYVGVTDPAWAWTNGTPDAGLGHWLVMLAGGVLAFRQVQILVRHRSGMRFVARSTLGDKVFSVLVALAVTAVVYVVFSFVRLIHPIGWTVLALYLLSRIAGEVLTGLRRRGVADPSLLLGVRRVGQGWAVGTPGLHVGTQGSDQDRGAWAAGERGEKAVGADLEAWVGRHGGVVFHGLQFTPGKDGADLDHLVVTAGGDLVAVDAKNWAYATYTVTRAVMTNPNTDQPEPVWLAFRDGQRFSGSKLSMPTIVALWDRYLLSTRRGRLIGLVVMSKNPAGYDGRRYQVRGGAGADIDLVDRFGMLRVLDSLAAAPAAGGRLRGVNDTTLAKIWDGLQLDQRVALTGRPAA